VLNSVALSSGDGAPTRSGPVGACCSAPSQSSLVPTSIHTARLQLRCATSVQPHHTLSEASLHLPPGGVTASSLAVLAANPKPLPLPSHPLPGRRRPAPMGVSSPKTAWKLTRVPRTMRITSRRRSRLRRRSSSRPLHQPCPPPPCWEALAAAQRPEAPRGGAGAAPAAATGSLTRAAPRRRQPPPPLWLQSRRAPSGWQSKEAALV
jgi:hypothetical protein